MEKIDDFVISLAGEATVVNPADAPVVTSTPVTGASTDISYSYHITTSDIDSTDIITITTETLPSWLTLTDNGNGTADLTGTPTAADLTGNNDVKIKINDNTFDVYQEFSLSGAAALPDTSDAFPNNTSETADTDKNGTGNNANTDDDDDDGDSVLNDNDAFPLDPSESVDTDSDGIGDNADTDDDNDGVKDINDAFPLNANKSIDTDGIEDSSTPTSTTAAKSNDGPFGIGSSGPTFLLFLFGLTRFLRKKEQ